MGTRNIFAGPVKGDSRHNRCFQESPLDRSFMGRGRSPQAPLPGSTRVPLLDAGAGLYAFVHRSESSSRRGW